RARAKRKRGGARRVNYRESVWNKRTSFAFGMDQSDTNSKYFRPSEMDMVSSMFKLNDFLYL
ncbi:hypothetical protein evm_015206, partial [Chilo suppressalis]